MKIKTSELTGAALDWAVAKCEGKEYRAEPFEMEIPFFYREEATRYSTDWSQGGPIIERERFNRIATNVSGGFTVSRKIADIQEDDSFNIRWTHGVGPTPLIAAMRCYVASKLGDEIHTPEELK